MAWGLVLVGPRMSGRTWISAPVLAYIELMRNTPLLVQLYVIYFGLPLVGLPLSSFACGVLGIASQHGAFLAEVYRGGIEAVSVRQREAAKALGMTRRQVMRLVVLPQAWERIVPAVGNQLVILVKDTSLLASIGVVELTLTAKMMIEQTGASFEVFVLVAVLYFAVTTTVGVLLRRLEIWQTARR
jgi:polar amino acid transport system permease protein